MKWKFYSQTIPHKIFWDLVLSEKRQMLLFFTSPSLWISKAQRLDNCRFQVDWVELWSEFLFSDNSSQNIFRPIYESEYSRTFLESFIADFVQYSSAIVRFFILEKRIVTRLHLRSILRFFYHFLLFWDDKF